jgi:hypothetical protein
LLLYIYILGFEDDLDNFTTYIKSTLQTQAEMLKVEHTQLKDATSDLGNGFATMSMWT